MASTKPVPKNFASQNIVSDKFKNLTLTQARHLSTNNELVLKTGIDDLDVMFEESVREGKIIEWGIPQGKNGRVIPLLFLRNHNVPAVWVYADIGVDVYAPAWVSFGLDLRRLFFIRSSEPVKHLRPLFLDNSFKIIVLDGPEKLSKGDLSFISQQARINKQIVFLIRNYFLSRNKGTALASLRINCWQNNQQAYSVNFIKGKYIKKINLNPSVVLAHD